MSDARRLGVDPRFFSNVFSYEEETGNFIWLVQPRGGTSKVGDVAGYKNQRGYTMLEYRAKAILAHRLAWFVKTGALPPPGMDIDHINGDRRDNRWNNLRLCTRAENVRNSRKLSHSTAPYKGITKIRQTGKWKAHIKADGKRIVLGYFADPIHAAQAYDKAARKHFGAFAKTNFQESTYG